MKSKASHLSRLIRFLMRDTAFTYADLIAYTGIHRDTAERLMRELRKEGPNKMYRIADWEADANGRMSKMVFARGTNPDKPKPPPMPATKRQAHYAARKTARALGRAVLSAGTAERVGAPSQGKPDAGSKRPRVGSA